MLILTFLGVLVVFGFGTLISYCNFSLGCLILKKKRSPTCRNPGSLGGIFASGPAVLGFFGISWLYGALDKRGRDRWAAAVLLILLPLLCFGFGISAGVIGWEILHRTDPKALEFGLGKTITTAAIGSSFTCWFVSMGLGRFIV